MQQNRTEYVQQMIKQFSLTLDSSAFSNFATFLVLMIHVVGAMVASSFYHDSWSVKIAKNIGNISIHETLSSIS